MRAVIFANGTLNDKFLARAAIQSADLIITADGGALHCLALGMWPAVVIGDLDSFPPSQQETFEEHGTRFLVHPAEKDQTDLELALSYAIQHGAEEVMLMGLLGGRLDQTLANLLLLSRDEWGATRLSVEDGPDSAQFLRDGDSATIHGNSGDIVSLIPLSLKVTGVTTQGLRWPLQSSTLEFGSTLSLSNEMIENTSQVQIEMGKLLLVHRQNGAKQEKDQTDA